MPSVMEIWQLFSGTSNYNMYLDAAFVCLCFEQGGTECMVLT